MCQKTVKDIVEVNKKELTMELEKNLNKYMLHVGNIKHQHENMTEIKKNLK